MLLRLYEVNNFDSCAISPNDLQKIHNSEKFVTHLYSRAKQIHVLYIAINA